jgi:hypothetical protein
MKISTSTRILFLAGIALGLATALLVHSSSAGRYIPVPWSRGSAPDHVNGNSSVSPNQSTVALVPRAKPTSPSAYDAAFFDGGDPGDPPTPEVGLPTSTPTPSEVDEDTPVPTPNSGGIAGSLTVAAPQPTLSPDQEMLGAVAVSRSSAPLVFPTPQRTASNALPWVSGQARGYAMLYALQPEARAVTESNISALLASHVREPYIAVLIDGTFGRDFTYLRDIITRLSGDGRRLTLSLYLANGASQRKADTLIEAPFVREDPVRFRGLIRRTGTQVQQQYSQIARDARAIFEFSLETNPENTNVAVVMLEDNLDTESYRVMLGLAEAELDGIATIVRNPCNECGVEGTDEETLGQPREDHRIEVFPTLDVNDGFTLDGKGFEYPNRPPSQSISSGTLEAMLQDSYKKGLAYFGLWRYGWQGLVQGQGNPLPSKRTYIPSSPDEMEYEIQVLRTGLPPEEDGQDSGDTLSPDDTMRIFQGN